MIPGENQIDNMVSQGLGLGERLLAGSNGALSGGLEKEISSQYLVASEDCRPDDENETSLPGLFMSGAQAHRPQISTSEREKRQKREIFSM